jgi:tRNA (Guanine-1)-methyltransferase
VVRLEVLTLFPQAFDGVLSNGIVRIAREKALLEVVLRNFRDFTKDRYKSVDGKPFGGGPGMLLACEPIFLCYEHAVEEGRRAGLGDRPRFVAPSNSRSETMSFRAARSRRWSSSTGSPGFSRGLSAQRMEPPTTPSRLVSWKHRNTRGRARFAAWTCRRSFFRGTMARSRDGAMNKPSKGLRRGAPT